MTIQQIYSSYYKHIQRDVFNAAVAADPTSYNQGEVVKVGNFVKWILKLYSNNAWKLGDIFETKDLLSKFIKYKSKLPIEKRDINRFNSVSELYSLIQTLEGQGVKTQSDVKRDGAEVVYEDSEWKIVIPHTKEASCIYGANTKWCTAGRERNMFDYYNDKGPLYININKQTGDKYQFYFESKQFMDAEDKKISPKKIGLSEGAIEYYKSIGKEPYFIYDEIRDFHDGFVGVYIEGKGWNFINKNCELLWDKDEWFDYIESFSNESALIKREGKYNLINQQGELLWKEDKWFDLVNNPFFNGFAIVKLDEKGYNFININGELVWKEDNWFDNASCFEYGFASVKKAGKGWNFINTNGELLWKKDKWFDYTGGFYEGFSCVKLEGKGWNWIDTNGELLLKEYIWFDLVCEFSNGFAKVKLEGKYNYINKQGELLWKGEEWFDDGYYFYNGFARVAIDGRGYNFINTNGELLWNKDKWFDYAWSFHNGLACVEIKGKGYNWIDTNGELLWNKDNWFDGTGDFYNGFAHVNKAGRGYNFINEQGELLWKGEEWFDNAWDFTAKGFACVEIKGKGYKINTKGELIEN